MNLLPKSHQEFSEKEYWNEFFKKRGNKAFEWYGEYPELCEYLHKYIKTDSYVLIIGCGNSSLSMDLYDSGIKKITNIDISEVAIRQMQKTNEKLRPDMKFLHIDATNMDTFSDNIFNTVLDKGTLDALMPDATQKTIVTIDKLFSEINRVTTIGGNYICVTLLQEHILRKLLSFFPDNNWAFRAIRCHEAEEKTAENKQITMPVFIVVCTKFKQLNKPILEVIEGHTSRFETITEVMNSIKCMQQAALVYSSLNKNNQAAAQEVSIELYKPNSDSPRFTIFIVDQLISSKNSPYAAFIVPQGRETEWLFSTKDGRKQLTRSAKYNRLAIVTMHRGQTYSNLDKVKTELNEHIKNLAPPGLKKSIPFLSLGNDVGNREVHYEGTSEVSGRFLIEDVTGENSEIFRRLIFLSSQNIIQSEAKLKTMRVRGGKSKLVVDPMHLACQHHIYMSLGVHMACKQGKGRVALIGLGGGGLCTFLNQLHPQLNLTAIDIDPEMIKIATEWFGLVQKDNIKLQIKDGLQFIKETAENGVKFNAVLFDVDSKDTSVGLSCPPKEFLATETLENIKKCIGDDGTFILNLVLRDAQLRKTIMATLKDKFSNIFSYNLEEDLNEIVFCSNGGVILENYVKNSTNEFNALVCKKKMHITHFIDVDSLMDGLKII